MPTSCFSCHTISSAVDASHETALRLASVARPEGAIRIPAAFTGCHVQFLASVCHVVSPEPFKPMLYYNTETRVLKDAAETDQASAVTPVSSVMVMVAMIRAVSDRIFRMR
ncbi:MAG: hypothetical protein JW395_2953 [Nitrospira sp.]|nr:hypothetical protein [Nitrospira sp.]